MRTVDRCLVAVAFGVVWLVMLLLWIPDPREEQQHGEKPHGECIGEYHSEGSHTALRRAEDRHLAEVPGGGIPTNHYAEIEDRDGQCQNRRSGSQKGK